MRSRKELKKGSKKILKRNYWRIVALTFFIAFMVGNLNMNTSKSVHSNIDRITSTTGTTITPLPFNLTKKTLNKIKENVTGYKPTRGFLANLFNNLVASENFISGLLNSLNQLLFHEKLKNGLIILLGALLSFLYWLLIKNILYVCEARFFLENHNYSKTNFKRALLPLRIKKNTKIIKTMLRTFISEIIWLFTIVGFFIKYYAYRMVPYILAENPNMKSQEVLELSENMMKKHKFELLKLDLSFIGYQILDVLTFHIFGILFLNPYKNCVYAEYYMDLRKLAKEHHIKKSDLLKDNLLEKAGEKYPSQQYLYEELNHKWLNTDYNKNYSASSLILMFFTASMIGWLWEVGLHLFQYGEFVNRGTLHGPWIQIYGFGVVFLLLSLKKIRNHPILTFIATLILCGIIEYATSWYLETFNGMRYWDYDDFFLNIHGRICLEGLLAFGIGGCAFIYFGAPFFESLYTKIKPKIKKIICIILIILFSVDFIYSSKYPNQGEGISQNIEQKN